MIRRISLLTVAIILIAGWAGATAPPPPTPYDSSGPPITPQSPTGDTLIKFTVWSEAEGGNGHWYGLLPQLMTWQEADSILYMFELDSIPVYLATVTSAAENEFILSHLVSGNIHSGTYDMYWLGGMYLDTEWVWTTNELFPSYTNWAAGEPFLSWERTALAIWGTDSSKAFGPPGTWRSAYSNEMGAEVHRCWAVVEFGYPGEEPHQDTLINLVQWRRIAGGNDHWYAVIPGETDLAGAMARAATFEIDGHTGYLATVRSMEENQFILQNVLFDSFPDSVIPWHSEFWLGGYEDTSHMWNWFTHEPWDFTNWWGILEPDNPGIETALAMIGPGYDVTFPNEGFWVSAHPMETWRRGVVEFGPLDQPPHDTLVNLTQWPSHEGGNNHWYGVLPDFKNWFEADSAAKTFFKDGVQGHLATATGPAENEFILEIYSQWVQTYDCNSVWLGANAFEGGWQWITGEPFAYTNWQPGIDPDSPGVWQAMRMNGPSPICDFIIPGTWRNWSPSPGTAPAIVEFDSIGPPPDTLINLVQWNDFVFGNGHWYAIIPRQMFWDEAVIHAGTFQVDGWTGHLATVTSAAENDFILDHVIRDLYNPSIIDEYWLGGRDDSGWSWITGEPWVYANWAEGEPNNPGVEIVLGILGAHVEPGYGLPGQWNNLLPNDWHNDLHQFWAVVEFGPPEEPPPDTLLNLVKWHSGEGGNDHSYAVLPRILYWEDANDAAGTFMVDRHIGYLATVTSQAENDFIFNHVIDSLYNPSILDEYWLGGRDFGGQWTWITGEDWNFTNWAPGEPNNVGIETALAMWGAHTVHPYRVPGMWNNALPNGDVNTLHRLWAIIEFGEPEPGDVVTPTDEWINIYCEQGTLDRGLLPPSAVIRVYDPQNVLCGLGTVRNDGAYGFIPIYRDDKFTDTDEGASPGDHLRVTINGQPVSSETPLIWTENGDVFELCHFYTQTCCEIQLLPGWNLISWNVTYNEEIETAIAGIRDCIDVVLSFDGEGLTFDPGLPEFSTLTAVDDRHGYWFRMHCPAVLTACGGRIPSTSSIPLDAGWNLVAYWPDVTLPTETALATVLDRVQVAVGFDQGALVWQPGMGPFNTLSHLVPEFGYWVKSSQPALLTYPMFFETPFHPGGINTIMHKTSGVGEPSRSWMSVYGRDLTLDGTPLNDGDHLEFFSSDDTKCGDGVYGDGILRFTSVYGQDETGQISKTYPAEQDVVRVRVNGKRVLPDLQWQYNGARVSLGALTSAGDLPVRFELTQNYPNPFNPRTEIIFSLPEAARVTLDVYNVMGQKVVTLVDGSLEAGEHTAVWNAVDESGQPVASGIYLYRLTAGDRTAARKMILLK